MVADAGLLTLGVISDVEGRCGRAKTRGFGALWMEWKCDSGIGRQQRARWECGVEGGFRKGWRLGERGEDGMIPRVTTLQNFYCSQGRRQQESLEQVTFLQRMSHAAFSPKQLFRICGSRVVISSDLAISLTADFLHMSCSQAGPPNPR